MKKCCTDETCNGCKECEGGEDDDEEDVDEEDDDDEDDDDEGDWWPRHTPLPSLHIRDAQWNGARC